MHNFRPTIGKLLNTVSRRFIWPSFVISAHTALLRNCLFVWNELNLLQEVLFVGTLCLWNRLSPFRPVRVNIQHLLRHPCCVMKGKYFCNRFECNEQYIKENLQLLFQCYSECHSLKVSTMSPRILWKLVSMSVLLASRNVTPGSWSTWSRARRYSGQATPLEQTCKRWLIMFFCLARLLSHF